MPGYFFNVHHERESVDSVGKELPDKHAAWKEATVAAGEICKPALRTPCQRGTTKVGCLCSAKGNAR